MKNFGLALGLLCLGLMSYSQKRVSGVVVDQQSQHALVGAAVLQQGTQNGTISDVNGRFAIQFQEGASDSLEVSFVGFETQKIGADGGFIKVELASSYELEAMIVKGVRASDDAPVTQTTISKKQIEEVYTGQHPIFMLEKMSPSIYSFSESGSAIGNYGQIRMRGIGQERINFTLNGVPLNDMIDHGVFFSNFTDIASSFESIQVQRGVGTSSTGASSYAGSINFESVNLNRIEDFSNLQLAAGSFDTYRANYNMGKAINDKGFGFYSSFSRLWSEGYKDHTETDAYSFFLTGGYFGERDMIRLTAFTSRSQNGLGYYTIEESILDDDPTFNNLTEDDNDDFAQYMVQLQYSRKLSDQLTWSNTLYYGGAGGDYAEGTPDIDSVFVENYGTSYRLNFFQINYPLKNDHYGVVSNLYYENDLIEFNTGVHLYTFQRENREEILPQRSNPYYTEGSQKQEIVWFANSTLNLNRWSVYADVQLRALQLQLSPDYSFIGRSDEGDIEKNWTFFNPKLGVTFKMNQEMSAYASVGMSHREPTKVDLLGGFQLNASNIDLVAGETDFDPERVIDYEAGIKMNASRLALNANVFVMDFQDEIAPIGEFVGFGLQKRANIANSYRRGVELQWNYLLSNQWSFSGGGSYIQSNIREVTLDGSAFQDVEHILSPNLMTSMALTFSPDKRLDLTARVNTMSESYMELSNDNDLKVPSWETFDFAVNYSVSKRITLNLLINNLMDAEYYTYGAPSDVDFSGVTEPGFYVQPPRNFYLTASFKF
ncbi:MAG: TonB-dependent receptor [Cyclobacteriaceae bacterium]|nr:TonB-dependent receptor [Cyclobacteriaceae bacterium HetDA_MAG_MS6]